MRGVIQKQQRQCAGKKPGATLVFHNVVGDELQRVPLDRRRRRLSSLARRADPRRPFIVSVHRPGDTLRPQDHTVRLRRDWKSTTITADDIVLVTYLPAGGGAAGGQSTGKTIGMAVAMLALAVAAPYAIAALGPAALAVGTLGNAALSAGLVLGGSYLLSLATRAKANKEEDTRPVYGVSGGGNLPRPGDRIPLLYGRCWTQPDLSQPDYSVYDGEDQILYKRCTLGLGKYTVHKLKLGNATLWTPADGVLPPFNAVPGGVGVGKIGNADTASGVGTAVEIVVPGATSVLVPGSVYSAPEVGSIEMPRASDIPAYSGPFQVSPVGEPTTRIQLDYSLPQGCYAVKKSDGKTIAAAWAVLFEYAPCDDDNIPTGTFSQLHEHHGTLTIKRAQRFTRYVDVALGRYVVRASNPIDWVGDHVNENATATIVNDVMWDGLRSHFAESITRPHVTEIAIRVRSGKGLGITAFADLWVEATRVLPVWNGSAWVEEATRKAIYAFKDVLQADYGGGLLDAEVDRERIKFYAAALTENDTFDGVIRGPVSVWEAASTVLGTMRAEPARIGNTWSLNRDEAKAARKHVFSRRQIVKGSSSAEFKIARDDGAADVIVEYSPGGDPRLRRDVRVTFGAETVTPRRVSLAGVTSHDHAHHMATWIAACAYYRREKRKIAVNRQGRIVTRGDPVWVDSWFMAEARGGGVLSRSGLALTLDTAMVVGASTYAMLRNRRAEEWGPCKVTADADPTKPHIIHLDAGDVAVLETFYAQTLDDVMAQDDQAMTSVLVGPLTEMVDGYLVDAVTPQGREVVGIDAVFDAPEVWDALGEETPAQPPITDPDNLLNPAIPVVPWVRAKCVQKAVTLEMEWAVGRTRGAARIVVQASYDEGDHWETVSEDMSTSGAWVLRHVEDITVRVGAFAVSPSGMVGPSVYTEFSTFRPVATDDDIEVRITAFNDALRGLVTDEFNRIARRIKEIEDGISRFVAAIDIDKKLIEWRSRSVLHETVTVLEDAVYQSTLFDASAEVGTVSRTFADADSAYGAYKIFLVAQVGDPENPGTIGALQSNINTTSNTFVDWQDGAYAEFLRDVSVNIWNADIDHPGLIQGSVREHSTAIGLMDGRLLLSWGIELNANGHVSGIRLLSDNDTADLHFTVDSFRMGFPNSPDHEPVFQIADHEGTARMTLRGDFYADGTITAAALNVAELSAISAHFGDAEFSGKVKSSGGGLLEIDFNIGRILIMGP